MKYLFSLLLLIFFLTGFADQPKPILTGADQTALYLPLLKGKNVAIVANQTSVIGNSHLVDTLKRLGVHIQCVFAPEHGFRGLAGAGEKVLSGIDKQTGVKVTSLYGKHLKPTREDLSGVQVVLFDIQDVGVRFYTYISTLEYVMEACAESKIPLIVLDRPNPNGYKVDGPVLNKKFKSFVGMQCIPVMYGMTIGEYAQMLNGERWLKNGACELKVIPLSNYNHSMLYELPVWPSPNLRNMDAIYLYPSLCFFEGTKVSVGRGTDDPFQIIGFPGMKDAPVKFKPINIPQVAMDPPYKDTICSGIRLTGDGLKLRRELYGIKLMWLKEACRSYSDKAVFFTPFFDKLAGTDQLREQIRSGKTEAEIKASWKPALDRFKKIRKKYLLYP